MRPFLAFALVDSVTNLSKLLYLPTVVLLLRLAELAYGAITGSTFFMAFGVPAAIMGGLGTAPLQEGQKA